MPSSNKLIAYGIPAMAGVFMFFGLLMVIFSPSTTGKSVLDLNEITQADLDETKSKVNQNLDKIPKFITTMFGNEQMNVMVTDAGDLKTYIVETRKGAILKLEEGVLEEPTMDVRIMVSTIERIASSENQVKELRDALKTKEIEYSTHKVKTKMRMGLARTAFSLYSFFS